MIYKMIQIIHFAESIKKNPNKCDKAVISQRTLHLQDSESQKRQDFLKKSPKMSGKNPNSKRQKRARSESSDDDGDVYVPGTRHPMNLRSMGENMAREAASLSAKLRQEMRGNRSNSGNSSSFNIGSGRCNISNCIINGNGVSITTTKDGGQKVTTIKINGPGKFILDINGKKTGEFLLYSESNKNTNFDYDILGERSK
jgi:hypothetical protein